MADLFGRLERLPATLRGLGLSDDDVRDIVVWESGAIVRLRSFEVLRRVCPGCRAKQTRVFNYADNVTYRYVVEIDGLELFAEDARIVQRDEQTVTL